MTFSFSFLNCFCCPAENEFADESEEGMFCVLLPFYLNCISFRIICVRARVSSSTYSLFYVMFADCLLTKNRWTKPSKRLDYQEHENNRCQRLRIDSPDSSKHEVGVTELRQ